MNKDQLKDKIKELLKGASGYLDLTEHKYIEAPSGLIIPKDTPVKEAEFDPSKYKVTKKLGWAGMTEEAYKALVNNELKDFHEQANKYTGVNEAVMGKHPDMIVADDPPVTAEMIQDMYPGKVFFETPASEPPVLKQNLNPKELEFLGVIAFELAHDLWAWDFDTENLTTHSGIKITKEVAADPGFKQVLIHALTLHTVKTEQAQKIKEAAKKGDTGTVQKLVAENLGMSPEQYKEWVGTTHVQHKMEPPLPITQGSFDSLFHPGITKLFNQSYHSAAISQLKQDYEELVANQAKELGVGVDEMEKEIAQHKKMAAELKIEKAMKYANMYGGNPSTLQGLKDKLKNVHTDHIVTMEDRLKVLEAVVASFLLAPRNMKVTDETLKVDPAVMGEMFNFFRVVVKRHKGEYHVSLE